MLCDSILDAIGNTPLVKLHRVTEGLSCNVYAKCEFVNPGGSVKDRIGYQMVLDAERQGRIKPGDTLIEPTSGNTGIGIALAGAARGYRVIITMPEKMSREKQIVLEALGAQVIRTPTEAAFDAPESHIGVAKRLQKELPNAHILDQYGNPSNPSAHYEGTAEEILRDLNGKVDMVVMTAGTGGTITGVAKKLKEKVPHVVVIGADPEGSILGGGTDVFSYKVEGIGYDFIPDVLDRKLVDKWIKTNDRNSFQLARRLIREEGLLVGGSSGSALYAALQAAQGLRAGQNCVVLFADGVRNYMSKFMDDKWMHDNNFVGPEPAKGQVSDLLNRLGPRDLVSIEATETAEKAINLMKNQGLSQLPVLENSRLIGLITEDNLLHHLGTQAISIRSKVAQIMNRNVPIVNLNTPLSSLQVLINNQGLALVVDENQKPRRILTKIDLVDWISCLS